VLSKALSAVSVVARETDYEGEMSIITLPAKETEGNPYSFFVRSTARRVAEDIVGHRSLYRRKMTWTTNRVARFLSIRRRRSLLPVVNGQNPERSSLIACKCIRTTCTAVANAGSRNGPATAYRQRRCQRRLRRAPFCCPLVALPNSGPLRRKRGREKLSRSTNPFVPYRLGSSS
jgi:hypothetical protein